MTNIDLDDYTVVLQALSDYEGSSFDLLASWSACMANENAEVRYAHLNVAEETGYTAAFYPDLDSMFSGHGDTPRAAVAALVTNLFRNRVIA